MNDQHTSQPHRGKDRRTGPIKRFFKILGSALGILVLVIAAVVVFGIPLEFKWVKGKIEEVGSEALGRTFAIEGPLTLAPSLAPTIQVKGIRIGNPRKWPAGDLARLESARAQLRVIPLLQGEIVIEEITVDGLQVNLETNAAGEPNWLLATSPPQSDTGSVPGTEAAADTDPEPKALAFVELADLSLRDIVLRHRDAVSGDEFEFALDEITGSAEDQEPMDLLIQGTVQDVPYSLKFDGGSLAALTTGTGNWPMNLRAEVLGALLTIEGEIAEPLRGRGLALDFALQGPRLKDLEVLLETRLPPIESFNLTGRIEEEGGSYRLADLGGEIAGTGLTGRFETDTSGDKVRILGDIDIQTVDLSPLTAAMDQGQTSFEQGEEKEPPEASKDIDKSPAATEASELAEPAREIDWDESLFTLDVFETFDAEFELRIHEVKGTSVGLRDASLAVTVEDGALSAPVTVTLAEVPFQGELNLEPVDGAPRLSVVLGSSESDIGRLVGWLAGVNGIEGGFELLDLRFSAGGESLRSLMETAELTLKIQDAALSYGHGTRGKPVEFSLDAADLRFPATDDSLVEARGALLGEPFTVQLSGGTFIDNLINRRFPARLKATGGGAELLVDGLIAPASKDDGTRIDFSFSGERLGGLAAWLGVSRDAGQGYALKGRVEQNLSLLQVVIDEAGIGNSTFSGQVGVRDEDDTAVTFAKLNFDLLDVKGFAGLFPEPSAAKAAEKKPDVDERIDASAQDLRIDIPILPQGVEIFDSDIDIAIARVKMDPADITDVSLSSKIRDGHVEEAPLGAVFAGTRFDGVYRMDLRGEAPAIGLKVQSGQADIGALLSQFGVVEGLAMTAGGFDLNIDVEGASLRAMLDNSTLSVGIRDGAWDFRAPGAQTPLAIRIPEASVSADPGKPITLAIDGRIDSTPIAIQVTTDTLGSFADPKEELSVELALALARAEMKLTGTAPLPVQAENLELALDLQGQRFSDFNQLFDVELPPFGPYSLGGTFGTRNTGLYVKDLTMGIGDSSLRGKLDLKTASQPPRLDMELVAERIQLDDFDTGKTPAKAAEQSASSETEQEQPEQGTGAKSGRKPLSPEVMRSLDARLLVKVERVLSGKDALGRGVLDARLENGRLSVEPVTVELPGGSAEVRFALEPDASGVALEAEADIEQLDYGILARRIDPNATTGGIISLDLDLDARGPDLSRVMEGANGHLDFGLWPEDLDAGLFELWAVNVIAALMKEADKDEASKVNCVIARLQVDNGVMQERVIFADTTKMRIEGRAEVNFPSRTLDVQAKPKAKKPEFFSLAVPVGMSGSFDDFGLDLNPIVLTGKAVSFVTSPLHVPIRRLFKEQIPADGARACTLAWSTDISAIAEDPASGQADVAPANRKEGSPDEAEDASPAIDILDLEL